MAESDQELSFVNNINDLEKELGDNSFPWSDVCAKDVLRICHRTAKALGVIDKKEAHRNHFILHFCYFNLL